MSTCVTWANSQCHRKTTEVLPKMARLTNVYVTVNKYYHPWFISLSNWKFSHAFSEKQNLEINNIRRWEISWDIILWDMGMTHWWRKPQTDRCWPWHEIFHLVRISSLPCKPFKTFRNKLETGCHCRWIFWFTIGSLGRKLYMWLFIKF